MPQVITKCAKSYKIWVRDGLSLTCRCLLSALLSREDVDEPIRRNQDLYLAEFACFMPDFGNYQKKHYFKTLFSDHEPEYVRTGPPPPPRQPPLKMPDGSRKFYVDKIKFGLFRCMFIRILPPSRDYSRIYSGSSQDLVCGVDTFLIPDTISVGKNCQKYWFSGKSRRF